MRQNWHNRGHFHGHYNEVPSLFIHNAHGVKKAKKWENRSCGNAMGVQLFLGDGAKMSLIPDQCISS